MDHPSSQFLINANPVLSANPPTPHLSLFGPDSEDESSDESIQEDALGTITAPLSADEFIKETPKSLSELLDIVHSRIQCNSELKTVPNEEQQKFISILTGELTSQFRVIHHQIDDPFLDSIHNKELHRRIVVEIVSILDNLFSQYLSRAARLTQRKSLFSFAANMSRLRAQLAVETNTRINIPLIRRKILDDLRGSLRIRRHLKTPPVPHYQLEGKLKETEIVDENLDAFNALELGNRAGVISKNILSKARKSLNEAMAFSESRRESLAAQSLKMNDENISDQSSVGSGCEVEEVVDNWTPHISRSFSLPELWQNYILDDVGQKRGPQHITEKEPVVKLWKIVKASSVESLKDVCLIPFDSSREEGKTTLLGEFTEEQFEQDLRQLLARHQDIHKRNTEDQGTELLSPLLQAHVHGINAKKSKKLTEHKENMLKVKATDKSKEVTDKSTAKKEITSLPVAQPLPTLFTQICPSPTATTEEYSEFLSSSQLSAVEPEPAAVMAAPTGVHDKQLDYNSMIHMVSFLEQQVDEMGYSRDDVPPCFSEPQTPTATSCDVIEVDHTHHPKHVQPAVVTSHLPNKEIVQTSDVRVSDRVPQQSLRLQSFKPLYNEISGEVTSKMVKEIDKNLRQSVEIQEVYEEILKSTPKDHLVFHKDRLVEPSIGEYTELSKVLASSTLKHRKNKRIVNGKLHRNIPPPWGSEGRKEWEENQSYSGPTPEDILGKGFTGPVPPELAPMLRAYNTWVTWWKSTVNADDYMKYVIKQENDYLGVVYHLYHSDDGNSEEEERKREEKKLQETKRKKFMEREKHLAKLTKKKYSYTAGQWNVNTVSMGGLGKDPDLSSELEQEPPATDILTKEDLDSSSYQARLEVIWKKLAFPEHLKIDMAIKYCSSAHNVKRLSKALQIWEEASELIEHREKLLKRLEQFERNASDPARYFSNTDTASRLSECKQRSHLHKLVDEADKKTSKLVRLAQVEFNDIITYQGRSYQDKMQSDRTEMLYWLQQERRQVSLMPTVQTLNISLPPLSISQVL
ncbi:uncharacterized protein [Dysidea avara]|uniref:uncharacterized protein isoform X2 n=1 Tax=Dysidea avara TaxID=196820 RepID=UPI00332D9D50